MGSWHSFEEWLTQVPKWIRDDPLWDLEVYRRALFAYDLAWQDCETILQHPLGKDVAWQLISAAGSASANIEEGYGRGFGADYARFLTFALSSAREARGWYYRSNAALADEVKEHRAMLWGQIIASLVTIANQQRARKRNR